MMYYSIHNFLFNLKFEGKSLEGYEFLIMNRDKSLKRIKVKDIEITSKIISFAVIDTKGNRIVIPFYRIKKVFNEKGELVFENEV